MNSWAGLLRAVGRDGQCHRKQTAGDWKRFR